MKGLSFSFSRFIGLDVAKRKLAKATGVPTTKNGLHRKLGRMLIGLVK